MLIFAAVNTYWDAIDILNRSVRLNEHRPSQWDPSVTASWHQASLIACYVMTNILNIFTRFYFISLLTLLTALKYWVLPFQIDNFSPCCWGHHQLFENCLLWHHSVIRWRCVFEVSTKHPLRMIVTMKGSLLFEDNSILTITAHWHHSS